MTRPWSDLAAKFRENPWPSTQALADLCEYIHARPIRTGAHGHASFYVLSITQTPVTWPYEGPHLEITPSQRGPVQFRYVDTHIPERMWRRHEPPEKVIERFRKTMIQLNWFTDPSCLD